MPDITDLLGQARSGDRAALDALFSMLYPELRRIAHSRLHLGGRDALIDTTALVNECYVKLARAQRLQVADRAHFFAYSATVMRSIVVDLARSRAAERHGGGAAHVTLSTDLIERLPAGEDEILEVHGALESLAGIDPRLVRLVEMRYFAGMTDAEIATALDVSERTVRRDWQKARLLLAVALKR